MAATRTVNDSIRPHRGTRLRAPDLTASFVAFTALFRMDLGPWGSPVPLLAAPGSVSDPFWSLLGPFWSLLDSPWAV